MGTVQKALAIAGVAKQSAKGSAATNPAFVWGLLGGAPFKVDVNQSLEAVTLDSQRIAVDVNRDTVIPGQALQMRAYPGSIGLLAYAALGAISDSGTTPNYTHVITPAAALPYLSGFGKFGGVLQQVSDAKVEELDFTWDKAGAVAVQATLIGSTVSFPSTITPGTDESIGVKRFQAGGGTFKLDTASATPAANAPIAGGSVKIANNLEPVILSYQVNPDDIAEGTQVLTATLKLKIANLADWRQIVTGSSGGTTISQFSVFGSFEHTFTIDANTSLKIAATHVAFKGDFPQAAPAGGAAELDLTGEIVLPTAGPPAVTITVKNAVASY